MQTPSSGQLVQQILLPYASQGSIPMKTLEVYDPTLRTFSQIGTVLLVNPRVNDPQATNLGIFNEKTPDGVNGLGNVIFVTHGDDDTSCPNALPESEVLAATFTGLGPAQGLVLSRITYTDIFNFGHIQGMEWATTQVPPAWESALPPGRTETQIVPLPRNIEGKPGELHLSTWVYTGAGAMVYCTPNGPVTYYGGTIASGCIFDPFYRLIPPADFALSPPANARDLKPTRSDTINPTGVVGTWLALDGKYPATNRIGFADTDVGTWPTIQSRRVYPQLIALAGEDGIFDTVDDRVLLCGGGQEMLDRGGEVSEPAAELVIIPTSQ
jgi:hypothetical protein